MKHLLVITIIVLSLCFQAKGQYFDLKRGISFSKTLYDFNTFQGKDFLAFRDYQNGFEISYLQNFGKNVSLRIPFGAGIFRDSLQNFNKNPFYNLGAQAQFHLHKDSRWINPYLLGGLNLLLPKEHDLAFQLPLGLGANIKLHPQVYLNWQSDFRLNIANWDHHLQHHIGFIYLLGNKKSEKTVQTEVIKLDSDGDGIPDELDLCPSIPGLAKFTGCPDTDGDGIEDIKDECPEIAGLAALKGCPDTDGDGVSDNKDECPNLKGSITNKGCPETDKDSDGDGVPDKSDLCPDRAGLINLKGCPDSDGDGISDIEDNCPNIPGPISKKGCPDVNKDADNDGIEDDVDDCPFSAGIAKFKGCPDTDGDGVQDKFDNCPNTPGPVSNKGCPVIEKEDVETLDFAMRAIQFDLGRATLKQESFSILDKISTILKKYSDYNVAIGGHTDNTGSANFNLELSEKRAKVCYEYLISKGIKSSRVSYAGFGSTKPVSDNKTETGRYLNRRVEFNLIPRN